MFDLSQYGQYGVGEDLSKMSSVASMIPYIGPLLGAGMNMIG